MTERFGDMVVGGEWKDPRNDGSDGGDCIPYSQELDGDGTRERTLVRRARGARG